MLAENTDKLGHSNKYPHQQTIPPFTRSSCFPFGRIPLEILYHITRILLFMLFANASVEAKAPNILIMISDDQFACLGLFKDGFNPISIVLPKTECSSITLLPSKVAALPVQPFSPEDTSG